MNLNYLLGAHDGDSPVEKEGAGNLSVELTCDTSLAIENILDKQGSVNFYMLMSFLERKDPAITGFFAEKKHIDEVLYPFLDFLKTNFFSLNKIISPGTIESLRNNVSLRDGVISYVETRTPYIISNQYTKQYSIIDFHLFLLGMDQTFDLVKDIQSNHFIGISGLFADSLTRICRTLGVMDISEQTNLSDELLRELRYHLQIGETVNKLALVHAVNFEERQISFDLGVIIRNNIDPILKQLGAKKEESICRKFNYLCGRSQSNFSHGVKMSGGNIMTIQKQINDIEKQQELGFKRQEDSNFGGNPEKKESARMILLGNRAITYLIGMEQMSMLHGGYNLELYNRKNEFLQDLVTVYNYGTERRALSPKDIIDDCIQNGIHGTKSEYQIETIYHIVLFDNSIDDESLKDLIEFFLNYKKQVNSLFFEEFVIKIIAQIIRRLNTSVNRQIFLPIIEKVCNLLRGRNMTHSALSYSKICFSVALYYISCGEKTYIDKGKRSFIHYKNLSSFLSDTDKSARSIQDEKEFYTILGSVDEVERYRKHAHRNESLEISGKYIIERAALRYQQLAIASIEAQVGKIIASMNKGDDVYPQEQLNKLLGEKIAESIFYNLCTISIEKYPNVPHERGFQQKNIRISEEIFITFVYSSISEKIFEAIFLQQEQLIKERFGNLIAINDKNTRLQRSKTELERLAFYDAETGLPNNNKLKADLKNAEQDNITQTLLLIEIPDHATVINMVGGENAWKERMTQILKILRELEDIIGVSIGKIYRKNDSTFAVISSMSEDFIRTYMDALPNGAFSLYSGMVVSEVKDLLLKADNALLVAKNMRKQSGDTYIVAYKEEHLENLDRLNKNRSVLQMALDDYNTDIQIVPHYQPICDSDGKPVKYESLARIEKKENNKIKIILPRDFIGIAEENGWSPRITLVMLHQIMKDLIDNPEMHVSVNINSQDWYNDGIERFLTNLAFHNMSHRITIEILETVHLTPEKCIKKLEHLRKIGFILAIDDYGTGESHAYRVALVKPENIKIDGVIIKMLGLKKTRADGLKLIQEAVSTAKKFGAKTTAEFVENAEIFEILKKCGVDYFQGEYFGMPEPIKK